MNGTAIEISPDEARPEGGYAVILVRGVSAVPDRLRFSVSAIGDGLDDPDAGREWSLGNLEPMDAELTPEGLVLRIGPELVDAAELQPGTPVVFALPAARIRAELNWPDLPVTIPGKLPAQVIDAADLRAHKIENMRIAAEAKAAEEARKEAERKRAAGAALAAPVAARGAEIAKPDGDGAVAADRKSKPGQTTPTPARSAVPPAPPAGSLQASVAQTRAGRDELLTPRPIGAGAQEQSFAVRNWLSIALAIIAVPALAIALWPSLPGRLGVPSVQSASFGEASPDWLTRVLAVGDVSPAGADATKVTAEEALQRAERAIFQAGTGQNPEERRFWLRKAITLMLSEPRSRWAITQLGALHTASTRTGQPPDYRSAKTLWELASASGDNVASCFLAQLYELGLGVPADGAQAKRWYKRANAQGGCNLHREDPPERR